MDVLLSISLFLAVGAIFVFANMTMGSLFRPRLPHPEKASNYECGEPTIGTSWVQFDLRFYIVALVYLVFDVEVALFYPWAVAYGKAEALGKAVSMTAFQFRSAALVDMLIFFGVLVVGFAYLWKFRYLDWVRSSATTTLKIDRRTALGIQPDLSQEARIDRVA
jgi:NADH-quinone oxidoreductase subunit A